MRTSRQINYKILSDKQNNNIKVKKQEHLVPHAKSLYQQQKEKKKTISVKSNPTYKLLNIKKEEYKISNKSSFSKSKSTVQFDGSIASPKILEFSNVNHDSSGKKLNKIYTQKHLFKFHNLKGFLNSSRSTPNLELNINCSGSTRFNNRKKIEEYYENDFLVNKEKTIQSNEKKGIRIEDNKKIENRIKNSSINKFLTINLEDTNQGSKLDENKDLKGWISHLKKV
jgi:hypothetical protein